MTASAVLLAASTAAASWLFVGLIRRYSLARGVLDVPNVRSSHSIPTPRGGGVGLIAAALLGFVAGMGGELTTSIAWALVAVLTAAGVGWLDDRYQLTVRVRLVAHAAAGALLIPLVSDSQPDAGIVVLLAWAFVTVSAINVVNFMDGIDGLIGIQALLFGTHIVLLSAMRSTAWVMGIAIAAASTGFLLWNWSPARIFLGDSGSGAIAVLGVLVSSLAVTSVGASVPAVFLPVLPITLDAGVTILRRWLRGERLTAAHRSHLYQRLANEGKWGHAWVAITYGSAAAVAIVIVATLGPFISWGIAVAFTAALIGVGWFLDRRFASL